MLWRINFVIITQDSMILDGSNFTMSALFLRIYEVVT